MAQRLVSPGVSINEVDLSLRVTAPTGVGVLVTGFTTQGPTDEVVQVTSIQEYEAIYGKPYTAAERYSYYTVKALFDSPANVYFSRLPYGSNAGNVFANDRYSALVYPTISAGDTWYLTKPSHLELTREEYEVLVNGGVNWKTPDASLVGTGFAAISSSGMVILNTSQTTINEVFEGYYLGVSDNRDTDPASNFIDIVRANSVNNEFSTESYTNIPTSRLDFNLSATSESEDSMSEDMENIARFDIGTEEFTDVVNLGLFKLSKTPFNKDEISLSYSLVEAYTGSFDPNRESQNENGGSNVSLFLENVENESLNLRVFINPNVSDTFSLSLSGDPFPTKKIRTLDSGTASDLAGVTPLSSESEFVNELFPLGLYQQTRGSDKTIGNIPTKVERVLDLVENTDLFDIDISVEGGLGTIWASTRGFLADGNPTLSGIYDETATWSSLSGLEEQTAGALTNGSTVTDYTTIFNIYNNFAKDRRKDHIFIADPIRQILVNGEFSKVLTQTELDGDGNRIAKTFSRNIYWPFRNQYRNVNTNFSVGYGNWVQVFDDTSSKNVWVPYSGFAASLMANMENVWDAPAGLTRGLNDNFSDIAFYPKQKDRDQLYKININPVVFFPADGFVTWGQKTFQKKPSSFDRINVRRVFLFLEKATMNTAKFFVFEPNNLFTRTRVINTLTPLFEQVKNSGGIVDYLIICNEKNNTSEIIEQNEMKVDIYIKPTKTAEFILIDFHATRQDANFEELI